MEHLSHAPPPADQLHRCVRVAALTLLALSLVIGIVLVFNWPFTGTRVVRDLEHFSSSEVKLGRFQEVYFPHPGYVAEGVSFSRKADGRGIQLASVQKLECVSSWLNMMTFTHRVSILRIEGLHVLIPNPVPRAMPFFPSMKDQTTVTTLVANGAVLEIAPRQGDGSPLRFDIKKLILGNVEKKKSISLDLALHLPEPSGDLAVTGKFGPFSEGHVAEMPLSGSYDLERTDLGIAGSVAGMLASRGSLDGILSRCHVRGNARIDNFQINNVRHPIQLSSDFDTVVDGLHGNIAIRSSKVRFLGTELAATGSIQTASGGGGKAESLDVTTDHARIEDLLRLFVKSDPPAVSGPIRFRADLVLPPGPQMLLRKLRLNGNFQIPTAEFVHPETQQSVDKLSLRARGKKVKQDEPAGENVSSSIDSEVDLRNGTAFLSHATFTTPGANFTGEGKYNLITDAIDLHGKFAMAASLSKAAGGIKSVFLFPLNPLFKKGNAGAVLPVHISGRYPHPSFRVSLTGSKSEVKPSSPAK